MKFNLPQPAPKPPIDTTVRLGNVYPCKGGGKTHYWIVIGFNERTVNLLGVNSDGVVTSTANYGAHCLRRAEHRLWPRVAGPVRWRRNDGIRHHLVWHRTAK